MKLRKNKRLSKKRMRGGFSNWFNEWNNERKKYKSEADEVGFFANIDNNDNSATDLYDSAVNDRIAELKEEQTEYNKTLPALLIEKRKLDVGGENGVTPEESNFIQIVFEQMFPAEIDGLKSFILFMEKLVNRNIFKLFIEKKNKKNVTSSPTSSECYNHIKAIIIDFNNKIPLTENLNLLDSVNEFNSIFSFKFIADCGDSIINKNTSSTKVIFKIIVEKIVRYIEGYNNEWADNFYFKVYHPLIERFEEYVPHNRYILFQIALEMINIIFLHDTRFFNKEGRKKCNNINAEKNRFHITLTKILFDMKPEAKEALKNSKYVEPAIDTNTSKVEYDMGAAVNESVYNTAPFENPTYAAAPNNDDEYAPPVNPDDEEAGGGRRRTRKRKRTIKQKKSKKKTYKYRKLRKLRRK